MMSFTHQPAFSIARTCSPPIYGAQEHNGDGKSRRNRSPFA